mmetsp:Transcript_24836/g.76701  ORF Transcript_24836/g.76701 Transcript_24836/m.76701 type:complete len:227 (-) Transcript_24836:778-1458(-)
MDNRKGEPGEERSKCALDEAPLSTTTTLFLRQRFRAPHEAAPPRLRLSLGPAVLLVLFARRRGRKTEVVVLRRGLVGPGEVDVASEDAAVLSREDRAVSGLLLGAGRGRDDAGRREEGLDAAEGGRELVVVGLERREALFESGLLLLRRRLRRPKIRRGGPTVRRGVWTPPFSRRGGLFFFRSGGTQVVVFFESRRRRRRRRHRARRRHRVVLAALAAGGGGGRRR